MVSVFIVYNWNFNGFDFVGSCFDRAGIVTELQFLPPSRYGYILKDGYSGWLPAIHGQPEVAE